ALFRDGYVLGTANYLAPELCGAVPFEDCASDLFSLGVTLFEMLTGRLPYPPGTLRQTFRRHQFDLPAPIESFDPDLSPALVSLVRKLLNQEMEDRPSAAMVVRELVKLEIATLRRRSA